MERIVLSTWLIRLDSFMEPARSGWDLCFGRLHGEVVVDVVVDGVGEADGWMKPPGAGSGRVEDMDVCDVGLDDSMDGMEVFLALP